MALDPQELQIRELKDLLIQLNKTVAEQTKVIELLRQELKEAKALAAHRQEQIDYLTKKLYGSSSEKQKKVADGQITLEQIMGRKYSNMSTSTKKSPLYSEDRLRR